MNPFALLVQMQSLLFECVLQKPLSVQANVKVEAHHVTLRAQVQQVTDRPALALLNL